MKLRLSSVLFTTFEPMRVRPINSSSIIQPEINALINSQCLIDLSQCGSSPSNTDAELAISSPAVTDVIGSTQS